MSFLSKLKGLIGRNYKPAKGRSGYPPSMRTQRQPAQPAEEIPSAIHLPRGAEARGRSLPNIAAPHGIIPEEGRSGPWAKNRAFRGVAFGEYEPGLRDISEENKAHWTFLPDQWAREFVYNNQEFHVHSTNVAYAQYWIESEELYMMFKSGHGGTYANVTEAEAIEFTQVASKGTWVIDVLIGRENLKGHACWTVNGGASIKPYTPGYRPGAVPTIPQSEISKVGEEVNLIPDVQIVGQRTVAQEDIRRDYLRRSAESQEDYNRRILGE